jgi:ribosomal protein S18 acetylase RimI-like enzyme
MQYIQTNRLTKRQEREIGELQSRCLPPEGLSNEPFLSNEFNVDKQLPCFFLAYDQERLCSFLACFLPSAGEAEVNGFTDPQMRSRGCFSTLFAQARAVLIPKGYQRFLLQVEPKCKTAKAYVQARCPEIQQTEYRLCLSRSAWKGAPTQSLRLQPVEEGTALENARIGAGIFSQDPVVSLAQTRAIMENPDREGFLCMLDDEPIGICNLHYEDERTAMLYGIGILPGFRGKGYGSALISLALDHLFERAGRACLEVDSDNLGAFALYRRLGFAVVFQVDYHLFTVR